MNRPDTLDRYLTQKIVGEPMVVTLGQRDQRHLQDGPGIWISLLTGETALARAAARVLWADASGQPLEPPLAGQPLSLAGLRRWRWRLCITAALAWGGALFAAGWYVHG